MWATIAYLGFVWLVMIAALVLHRRVGGAKTPE
jgi:hypothetical protein